MERLGRYEIVSEVGRGGMGIVYRGVDTALGRTVAIKTIRLGEQGTPEEARTLRERLIREARAAGTLSHPNVVTVHDIGQEGDVDYIVMEFVQGRPLDRVLADPDAPHTQEFFLEVLEGAARALDYAHAHGIVHRDVKPGNILIQDRGGVKISDFGIAKLTSSTTMTEAGTLLGSPHYMAPEQLKGEPVTGSSDQFALAAIAYTLLTGRKPFDGDTFAALAAKVLFEDPPSPLLFNTRLSREVEQVLGKGMAKDPAGRFESCVQFVDALKNACRLSGPEPLPGSEKLLPRRNWVAVAAAAALLLVVIAVGLYLLKRQQRAGQAEVEALRKAAPATTAPVTEPKPAAKPVTPLPEAKRREPARGPAPAPRAVEQRVNPADGLVYVKIPAGTFQMGCSPGDKQCDDEDEKPVHTVTVSQGFWLGQTEVTVEAYQRFARATGRELPPAPRFSRDWQEPRQPMANVRWDEAEAFCQWAGGRLPTEAEWEYAARAGSRAAFYGPVDAVAWNSGEDGHRDETVHAVGQKVPNAWGLYDVLGNVREWCRDFYGPYTAGAVTDPSGPGSGSQHVMRGGAFNDRHRALHVSFRFRAHDRNSDFGFRCALPGP